MENHISSRASRGPTILIATGSAMFLLGLAVSAAFAPEWRVLHVLQALIYVAVIALARRRSAWGFGAGLFIAVFWNALTVFATTAARDGIIEVANVMRTGSVQRPDLLLSLFAELGHVLIIVGCAIGFSRLRPKAPDWRQFFVGGLACIGYLLAVVFLFGPPQAVQLMRHAFGLS